MLKEELWVQRTPDSGIQIDGKQVFQQLQQIYNRNCRAGQRVYDTKPDVVVSVDTVEAPVSELSPCGPTTMKDYLATFGEVNSSPTTTE